MVRPVLGIADPSSILGYSDDVVVRMEVLARSDHVSDRDVSRSFVEQVGRRPPREDAHSATSPAGAGVA